MIFSSLCTLLAFLLYAYQFIGKKGNLWHIVRYAMIIKLIAAAIMYNVALSVRNMPSSFDLSAHFLFGGIFVASLIVLGLSGLLVYKKRLQRNTHRHVAVVTAVLWVCTFIAPWLW